MVYSMDKMDDLNSASGDRDAVVDLEMGCRSPPTKTDSNRVDSFYSNSPKLSSSSSPNLKSLNNNPNEDSPNGGCDLEGSEKKKKRMKKPPKPPRPPRPVPLDLCDQKLVNELTEIAMLKKARMERMKALKKLKNSRPPSTGNWCALVVTVFFCLVIFWHGLFSRGSGVIMGFHGSPESSFVSVQTYKNANAPPTISPSGSTVSSSPKNVEPESGLEMNGEKGHVVG